MNSRDISNLRKTDEGFYVIPTIPENPHPYYSTWNQVIDFMRGFGIRFDIAGGHFYHERIFLKKKYDGCAGYVFERLRERGLKPRSVRNCCFT